LNGPQKPGFSEKAGLLQGGIDKQISKTTDYPHLARRRWIQAGPAPRRLVRRRGRARRQSRKAGAGCAAGFRLYPPRISAAGRVGRLSIRRVASAAGYAGETLTVDISKLEPGSTVRLVLRLVNNDSDTGSHVTIGCNCAPTALDDMDDDR